MGRRDSVRQEPSVGQDIVARLRGDIVRNVFAPNARLKFADLTSRYDVGVGTLREALSQLVTEGFVALEAGKGFNVGPASRAELVEITEHYVDFEKRALAEAIEQGDDEWESRIVVSHHRLSIIESRPWSERMERHSEWVERHREFHGALVAACDKVWLIRLRSLMFDQLDRYRFLSKMTPEGLGKMKFNEHKSIMQASLDRDVKEAKRLIEKHIRGTSDEALKAL
jgi:GntR family carbon starvation induced transcriptional regulator